MSRLASILALSALALLPPLATAPSASAAEHPIATGKLTWSVKESWRKYIGTGTQVGDGATVTGWAGGGDGAYPEGFEFPVVAGSFDDETNTTRLKFAGYVHFQSWCGYLEPGKCALDTRFSDLELEIGPAAQVLRGTHTGYSRTDPGGELHVDEDVVLARFDIAGATTSFSGGQSTWSAIPTVAGPGFNIYGESTVLDDTAFAYAGPGGLPDLGEHWDEPGAPALERGAVWLADPASNARTVHPSRDLSVVHSVDLAGAGSAAAKLVVAARDATTLDTVGTPYTWSFPGATASDRHALRTAFDPETETVFFATYHDGPGHDEVTVRRATWDPTAQGYTVEPVGSLGAFASSRRVESMAWNPIADELAVIATAAGSGDAYVTHRLHRFGRDGASWTHAHALLRSPDSGAWAGAAAVTAPFASNSAVEDLRPLAVARDGSYVAAAGATGTVDSSNVSHRYPAVHVELAGDGSATVTPIDGTTTPRTVFGTYYGFSSLTADGDGSLLLHNSSQTMDGYVRVDVADGEAATVGGIVDAPVDAFAPFEISGFASSMAADPATGLVWATDTFDPNGHRLHAIEDGEIVASYVHDDFPPAGANGAFGRLATGPDSSVYLPIKDGASPRLGYRRLAYLGIVPEVTDQPESRSVTLGAGEASEEVELSVALADPGDAIQWQARKAGEAVFSDVEGATATTLTVEATPATDGAQYRAKASNAAGAIVSDVATLSVSYAPRIVSDVASRTVTSGTDALFLVSADANPEATVSWQRRVDGFWQPIAPGDDNFAVNGPSLSVLDTNVDQSGALFRAKLVNPAGTVYSRTARLTVQPSAEIPPEGLELEDVTLSWTGNLEIQKAPPFGGSNYLSAGISDGEQATYAAGAGSARIFQVSALGDESPATWATRASHVTSGGRQLARLYGGTARLEADGSARVEWDGAFTVNFYGGRLPFSFSDPALEVEADGSGTLTADLSGYASSQANPNERVPLAPVADVTVATFSDVEVAPGGAVAIAPDYEGVEVTVPAAAPPQDRVVAGWGAWPQPFVDFQLQTGLSSYWYSSGGAADQYKRPDPFTVDFAGAELPPDFDPDPDAGTDRGPAPADPKPSPPPATRSAKPKIDPARGTRRVGAKRLVRVATVRCPAGAHPCTVRVRKRVALRISGRRHWGRVLAPRTIAPGARATLRLRLPRAATRPRRLTTARLEITVTTGGQRTTRVAHVRVRGRSSGSPRGIRSRGQWQSSCAAPSSCTSSTTPPSRTSTARG